tara:strand:- start:28 stop:753 length:726 start_codon:yes stop_codon:yes gene_type:complete
MKDKTLNTNIILKAVEISNTINNWLSNVKYNKISIGENCNTSWYLKSTGNKDASYPYDWIFSNTKIVTHSIKDNFQSFLNKDLIFQVNENKAGHSLYHNGMFNHLSPLKSDNNYQYYKRASNRFIETLNNPNNNILFVCTVLPETNKRPDWASGFTSDFKLPNNQTLESFNSLIKAIKNVNSNSKFIFINQFTNNTPKIEIKTTTQDCLWLDYYSEGSNNGVQYLNELDDLVMKIIYKGMN